MDNHQVSSLLLDFYNDPLNDELSRYYLTKSFPEILSIERREMSHSAFLAWLLDSKESHGLGAFPLKQLLKILVRRDALQGEKRHNHSLQKDTINSLAVDIINETVKINNVKVNLEKVPDGRRNRFDIYITGDYSIGLDINHFCIILENKVYSNEHHDQTSNYYTSVVGNKRSDNTLYIFVYLSPLSKRETDNLAEPQCSGKEFIQICYQDILDMILEPAIRKNINDRIRFIIKEYIHSLAMPVRNFKNKNLNTTSIMAIDSNTKNMLSAFWEKNEDLLLAVMKMLSEDDDIDSTIRDKAKQFYEVASKREKDKTHYRFNGIQANGKFALIREVIKYLVNEKNLSANDISERYKTCIKELQKTKEVFDTIHNELEKHKIHMTCTIETDLWPIKKLKTEDPCQLVYDSATYRKLERKGKELHNLVDDTLYIYNQWSYRSIDYFIYFLCKDFWGADIELIVMK